MKFLLSKRFIVTCLLVIAARMIDRPELRAAAVPDRNYKYLLMGLILLAAAFFGARRLLAGIKGQMYKASFQVLGLAALLISAIQLEDLRRTYKLHLFVKPTLASEQARIVGHGMYTDENAIQFYQLRDYLKRMPVAVHQSLEVPFYEWLVFYGRVNIAATDKPACRLMSDRLLLKAARKSSEEGSGKKLAVGKKARFYFLTESTVERLRMVQVKRNFIAFPEEPPYFQDPDSCLDELGKSSMAPKAT